jgi:hypothetical protein
MKKTQLRPSLLLPLLSIVAASGATAGAARGTRAAEKVTLLETPEGGIQPQAALDARGSLHLIYFKGSPGSGDLFYTRRDAGKERFTEPLRVNSRPGSAVATGTVRGGQLAVGKGSQVHVIWFGSARAEPRNPIRGAPLLYTRLDAAGAAFEPERNLMERTFELDGGGTIAADGEGAVYAAWHGRAEGDPEGEAARRMWVARSLDGGGAFSREAPISTAGTGCCACCSTRAFADTRGALHVLYRSAEPGGHRDLRLLTSTDRGRSFRDVILQRWKVPG